MVVNHDWFFLSHRKAIGEGAVKARYDTTLVAVDTGKRAEVEALGMHFIDLKVNPTGTNPLEELQTLWFLIRLFRKHRPNVVHNVGLKNFLWGGIAAKLTGVPVVVNAVSGLGVMFSAEKLGATARLMMAGMKYSMKRRGAYAIFQNKEDKNLFKKHNVVKEEQCVFIKGSGCDLNEYAFAPIPSEGKVVALYTGRMVKEKGVETLVEAANLLRSEYENKVEFRLCGGLHNNPLAYKKEEIEAMCDGEYIRWMGLRNDIPEQLKQCSVMVFPSYYREGLPKSLIEASSVGRPIITCDSVGCRDCVEDGVNGFLIKPRDSKTLAEKLKMLIDNRAMMERMGKESRRIAERDYDVNHVVKVHLDLYSKAND